MLVGKLQSCLVYKTSCCSRPKNYYIFNWPAINMSATTVLWTDNKLWLANKLIWSRQSIVLVGTNLLALFFPLSFGQPWNRPFNVEMFCTSQRHEPTNHTNERKKRLMNAWQPKKKIGRPMLLVFPLNCGGPRFGGRPIESFHIILHYLSATRMAPIAICRHLNGA